MEIHFISMNCVNSMGQVDMCKIKLILIKLYTSRYDMITTVEGGIDLDYTDTVKKAIEFIHSQYSDSFKITDVANHVYLSPSYFSTVFRTLSGYTIKEYILRYRLYKVALELKESKKRIIEITYENGFSSQQALTKSFSQVYGIAPARFRQLNPLIDPFPPENLFKERGIFMELSKVFEKVHFVKKEAFFVIGIETDINYNTPNGTGSIGKLYERWYNEKYFKQISNQVNDALTYGMTFEETEDDTAKYMVAVEVSSLSNLSTGFIGRRFEACEYAVFNCTLEDETSGKFFQYFFKTFLKENKLSQPDAVTTKKGNTYSRYPLFEVYDKNFVDKSSHIQIYAPIIR